MNNNNNIYSKAYNEKSFWNKIKEYGKTAGKKVIKPALSMYYCLSDKDTPLTAKLIIVGALGYFILPMDAIPDISPLIGFTDDLGAILTAYEMVKTHVKPQHIERASQQTQKWLEGSEIQGKESR